jgi:hypothetical protein
VRAFTINPALPLGLLAGLMFSLVSCTGIQMGQNLSDICACVPTSAPIDDHRHDAKHIPLPVQTPQEITVNTILNWPVDPDLLPADAPREGRELTLFHIRHAFLQRIKVEHNDCDIHFEISNTPDKTGPRVIVETPVDSEYCPSRRNIQQQLAQHNIIFNGGPLELSPALPVDVIGLAFEDFQHAGRGSNTVATIWELHPAIVQLTQ